MRWRLLQHLRYVVGRNKFKSFIALISSCALCMLLLQRSKPIDSAQAVVALTYNTEVQNNSFNAASKTFVLAVDKPGPMTSPFDIPIEDAGRNRCENFRTLGKADNILSFLQHSTKVVFGRNPFSRIFSAYIDKIFSPNPFYWKYWGERALRMDQHGKAGKQCASEVSFAQFVQLVIVDLHKSDVHLRPVYDECRMCDVFYDVIGKLETTVQDIDYISTLINVSSSFQREEGYSFASKMDIVYDSVKSAFSWKRDIVQCISLDEMGLRLWRKLQIRGVFASSIPFPFQAGEIERMPAETFISACKDAIIASTNREQLNEQKKQAMLELYKAVKKDQLLSIGKAYQDDFHMFEYDPHPAELFDDLDKIDNTGVLNWRRDWTIK